MDSLQILKAMGAFRPILVEKLWEVLWLEDGPELEEVTDTASQFREGIIVFARHLGFELRPDELVDASTAPESLAKTLLFNCIRDDSIRGKIRAVHGTEAAMTFAWAQDIGILLSLCNFQKTCARVAEDEGLQQSIDEQENASVVVRVTLQEMQEDRSKVERILGNQLTPEFADLVEELDLSSEKPLTATEFARLAEHLTPVINELVPTYGAIAERVQIASTLIEELEACPTGHSGWQRYEDTCFRILRHVSRPQFRFVRKQVRTEDGFERRDAILPHVPNTGLWGVVRHEYESRHIVCEFKNSGKQLGKNDLNQLRLYLRKPTVGRFGLLFFRGEISDTLIQAQKHAYREDKALILLLNDERVRELLVNHAYLGTIENVLLEYKLDFELSY